MTDRGGAPRDQLERIRRRLTDHRNYLYDDVTWLVAEVDRRGAHIAELRHMLEMTERALQNATAELGLIDDDA